MYDWYENFSVAENIFNHLKTDKSITPSVEEGLCRTIVNISYYACFHKVAELNKKYGCAPQHIPGKGYSHIDELDRILEYPTGVIENHSELNKYLRRIKQLKEYRTQASYRKEDLSFTVKKANLIYKDAKDIHGKLCNLKDI